MAGALGAALLLPTKFGEAAFKYRFDKAVEGLKAEQGAKLEQLRERLNHFADRSRRSNEMEFAAIREVWDKTIEAQQATVDCTTSLMEYPDLKRLTTEELDGFLTTSGFSREQADQVRQAADHNDMYVKVLMWRSIANAGQKNFDAELLLRKQRIFMPEEIRKQFSALHDLLRGAQVERRLQLQHPHIPRAEWGGAVLKFAKEGEASLERLAQSVNQRLSRQETIG
ncbi:hypothetical protein [Bradyrhizobium japonicum]|nr:hypothetical protein [Bradyrhizobium japonicum]